MSRYDPARFWAKVDKSGDCWTFLGAKNAAGYGHYFLGRVDGKRVRAMAHRVAKELATGEPVPADMQIDHLCKNTSCVNPEHLEVVTPRENQMRSTSQAARNAAKTHCPRNHALPAYVPGKRRACAPCKSGSVAA